ncbi:MAG: hypothetical protein MUE96_08615 [Bacteroidia bacterium]|jgi:hypothetical protein|nr:hypothetical protein [Bacteroidia bacterium]
MRRFITLLIITCIVNLSYAQRQAAAPSKVSLRTSSGKRILFTIASQPKWTIVNGVLNIAMESNEKVLLQVSQINTYLVKDTLLPLSKSPQLVLIRGNQTYINRVNDSSTIQISCDTMQPGKRITVYVNGYVWRDNERITVRATLRGILPKAQQITTH